MSCHIEYGANDKGEVAVLLSCPGKSEEKAGRPAAGATGTNLNGVLKEMGLSRDEVLIDNSWPKVMYSAKTGDTQPTRLQVVSPQNLNRLKEDLEGRGTVIALGQRAIWAVDALIKVGKLDKDVKIARGVHTSNRSLSYSYPVDGKGQEASEKRYREMAHFLIEQLQEA